MTEVNRIVIYPDSEATCWMARFEGPHADGIIGLFGQPIIPCGYSDLAAADNVLAVIARLNPHCEVVLGEKQ